MPIYEYRCKDCQQVFEEWCKHFENGAAERTCPVCKGPADRIISNTSFALKGGGWYVTENGSHKGKAEASGSSAEKASACAPSSCSSGTCAQAGCADRAAS